MINISLVRLDKILAAQSMESRKDIKQLIKKGLVIVNDKVVKQSDIKIDTEKDVVKINGKEIALKEQIYIMMNKPMGVVSATEDNKLPTVIDILPQDLMRKGLFPAGRLDKDTVGFMLITDDGEFAHNILSPKHHVPKTYIATLDKPVEDNLESEFKKGVKLNEEDICKPAELSFVTEGRKDVVQVVITEGMYHQIKRMFLRYGYEVIHLKRVKIGGLFLDNKLLEGQARELTQQELKQIKL